MKSIMSVDHLKKTKTKFFDSVGSIPRVVKLCTQSVTIRNLMALYLLTWYKMRKVRVMVSNATFSYFVVVSFIGGLHEET